MARRTFDVIDVTEILVHWHAGRSLNEMSGSLGVDRKTIRKCVAPGGRCGHNARAAGLRRARVKWQDRVREWFPELADNAAAAGDLACDWPASTTYYIAEQLKAV